MNARFESKLMSLNKSNGNMFSWITHTWNPLAGECLHKCGYCSTNKLFRYPVIQKKYSGLPRLDDGCLSDNLGKDRVIFVVAQGDLFANDIPDDIIRRILSYCDLYRTNKYYFQTKNPARLCDHSAYLPVNSIIGTTIETNRWYPEFMGNTPLPIERADAMQEFDSSRWEKYLTIEPVMSFDLDHMINLILKTDPRQINIGANTFSKVKLPEPTPAEIKALISEIKKIAPGIEVKQKDNLKRLL